MGTGEVVTGFTADQQRLAVGWFVGLPKLGKHWPCQFVCTAHAMARRTVARHCKLFVALGALAMQRLFVCVSQPSTVSNGGGPSILCVLHWHSLVANCFGFRTWRLQPWSFTTTTFARIHADQQHLFVSFNQMDARFTVNP